MEEDSLEEYLLTRQKGNIIAILQDTDLKKHFSININFVELFENNTTLGNIILKNPEEALEELYKKLSRAQNVLSETLTDAVVKNNVHARVYGLPACPQLHRMLFPKNEDLDLFLQVTGTVVRVSSSKILEYQRPYMCTKCKHIEVIKAVYDKRYIIVPPKKCVNREKCPGTHFTSIGALNVDNCTDYQEIKMQEQYSELGVGTMPCSMWVTLEDDLVDTCKPGDDITVCGTVKRRWGPLIPGKTIDVEMVLKANHLQVNNGNICPTLITPEIRNQFTLFWEKYRSRPLEGRDLILKSFCPKLYGMYIVKLAMAMVLAGGSVCTQGNEMGIQIRSEPHILLVGDPGTGKSQLLRYAAKVIPRSVLTTGIGTTSAGLTVAAIMEDGQWQLEGGALVLADGGICCIDEFNSMKSHDRTSIHEAMEQQSISVAKASMVCKLRTRCSILAATNPKGGHLDPSQPLSLNLALSSPLLSRFDIVLMIKDLYDHDWDNLIADHILTGKGMSAVKADPSLWNLQMLQQYFSIIKGVNPLLTPQANRILSAYYQAQRRAVSRNKARTTMRLLDSLIRLSQAHARLMYHTEVHVMDTLFAVILIESSMHGECAVLSLNRINVQAPFLVNPMENYAELAKAVLSKLGLQDILHEEIFYLRNDCKDTPEFIFDEEQSTMINKNSETLIESSFNSNEEKINSGGSQLENVCIPLDKNAIDKIESELKAQPIKNDDEKNVMEDSDFSKKIIPLSTDKSIGSESNILLSDTKNDERRKRKSIEPQKLLKQPKVAKNSSNLNDFQMLNFIRSANDDFDLSILNFSDGGITTENNACLLHKSENVGNSVNVDGKKGENKAEIETVNENIEQKISQNTKLKKFREKFSFKFRTNETFKEGSKQRLSEDRNVNDTLNEVQSIKNVCDIENNEFIRNHVRTENEDKGTKMRNGNIQQGVAVKQSKPFSFQCKLDENFLSLENNAIEEPKENLAGKRNLINNQVKQDGSFKNVVSKHSENGYPSSADKDLKEKENVDKPTRVVHEMKQEARMKQFREKFSFKPRNLELSEKNKDLPTVGMKDKSHEKVINNLKNHTQTSHRLFNGCDEDYEAVDFDF